MPVCPECGIDVPEEGLCAECRKEQASHRAGGSAERSKTGGAAGASRPLFWLALALAAVAVFAVAFFIGRSFAAGTTRELILYTALVLVSSMMVMFIKLWFWLLMNRNAITREIKRLELRIVELSVGGKGEA